MRRTFVDVVHRFTKAQQHALLRLAEQCWVTLREQVQHIVCGGRNA